MEGRVDSPTLAAQLEDVVWCQLTGDERVRGTATPGYSCSLSQRGLTSTGIGHCEGSV
jgi:hypothetical protein